MLKTKISKIISRKVVTVLPGMPVCEAIALMAADSISCLLVAENRKPLGIFTERDIVRCVNQEILDRSKPIRELMTRPVLTITGNTSIFEAYSLFFSHKIRHHVVVDNRGLIIGVMSQSDIVNHLGLEYFVEMRKIQQIMTPDVETVAPDVSVREVLDRMALKKISCVIVVDDRRPSGIITERDATRLVLAGVDLASIPVRDIMSSPVQTVEIGATVHKAASTMKKAQIRRVVVVDELGMIQGIITQSDIIKGLEGKYIESLKQIIQDKETALQKTSRELIDKTVYLDNILTSSIGMAIIATDSNFKIKYFNPVAEKVFDYKAESVIGRTALQMHMLEEIPAARLTRAKSFVKKHGTHTFTSEIKRNGITHWYDGRMSGIFDTRNRLTGYVLIMHDITERKQYEKTIHDLAFHDALTGLPNRVLLNDRFEQSLNNSKRTGCQGALMLLDLDRFKDVNDSLGHTIGDLLLKAVGDRLKNILRKSDTVSRMGGDEFVLLLPSITSIESTAVIADKIVRALRKPFRCDGRILEISASIGLAVFPDNGEDQETLLKNADIAMYRAKEAGRNNFKWFLQPK